METDTPRGKDGEKPPSPSRGERPQPEPGRRHLDLGRAASRTRRHRPGLFRPPAQTNTCCFLPQTPVASLPHRPLLPRSHALAFGASHSHCPGGSGMRPRDQVPRQRKKTSPCVQSKPRSRTSVADRETAGPRASCSSLAAVAKATLPPGGRDPQPGLGVPQASAPPPQAHGSVPGDPQALLPSVSQRKAQPASRIQAVPILQMRKRRPGEAGSQRPNPTSLPCARACGALKAVLDLLGGPNIHLPGALSGEGGTAC